ncbi:hypothetical protein L345_12547, partial [Ophiophagus hannah]
MRKQIPDVCGPLSPKAKLQADPKDAICYTGMKYRAACGLLFALPCVLFVVFLSLYLAHHYSDPAHQLKECKVELQNQTSQMRASLGSLEKRVEETGSELEKATKTVEKNATSQVKEAVQREMEKNKVAEEEIKQLKQQLFNLQQMKEQQQMEIQHLKDQLMKDKPTERSKGGLLLGPSLVLLPLLLTSLLL